MKITIEVESLQVIEALKDLQDKFENTAPLMEVLGNLLESTTMQRFENGVDPDGNKWEPNSEATLLAYAAKHGTRSKKVRDIYIKKGANKGRFKKGAAIHYATKKVLRDTGILMNSITFNHGNGWVEVGSPEPYAPTHQFGAGQGEFGTGRYKNRNGTFPIPWGDIPARPFLGLSPDDETGIMEILEHYLKL